VESSKHKDLKWAVRDWLLECDEVKFEYALPWYWRGHRMEGSRFDVVGFKNGYAFVAVECGALSEKNYKCYDIPIYHLPYGIFGSCNLNLIRRIN